MLINKKLKAFTILELMISMTLTAILVVFAFVGYNNIQTMAIKYTQHHKFISDYTQLTKALYLISKQAKTITAPNTKQIVFKNDSSTISLNFNDHQILLNLSSHTDTFHLISKEIDISYFNRSNLPEPILVKEMNCKIYYQNQKFNVSFHKDYDTQTELDTTLNLLPIDEQY